MRLLTNGTTRLVLVIGHYAIKIPRSQTGRRCNAHEAEIWRESSPERRAILCPILAALPGGWLVVMAAAEPISETEAEALLEGWGFPDWDYVPGGRGEPFEYKASDWGRLSGKLVAVDYSAPALDVDEEG
ncbi:conserved protein of unknown function [Methylorubrum extorquens]|uniref:Uncharacterized protein n=1 Tax=Methylorubrum extorquens TaxID=408 RepID=A0A2N9AIL7_METEX|nr:conserved protein of unknown function [Methylorubrum extorquens]